MASDKQIDANRRNAERSTGPRTARGKAAVRRNAMRHGLTCRDILLPDEDPAELAGLAERMVASLQPADAFEAALVDTIVEQWWRLRRLSRVEAGLFTAAHHANVLDRVRWQTCMGHSDVETIEAHINLYTKGKADPEAAEALRCAEEAETALHEDALPGLGRAFIAHEGTFATLSRYEAQLERALYRALHELQRRQAARLGQLVPPPMAADIDVTLNVEAGERDCETKPIDGSEHGPLG